MSPPPPLSGPEAAARIEIDAALEDSASLPDPYILAQEIADDLRSALGQIEDNPGGPGSTSREGAAAVSAMADRKDLVPAAGEFVAEDGTAEIEIGPLLGRVACMVEHYSLSAIRSFDGGRVRPRSLHALPRDRIQAHVGAARRWRREAAP